MNSEHTIEYCEKCTKRGFSPKSGLVCSLTEAKPDFAGHCPEFDEDEKEAHRIAVLKENRVVAEMKDDTLGMASIGIANPGTAGTIVMLAAISWFAIGYFYLDRIFFYPPILFVFGLVAVVTGNRKNTSTKKEKTNLDESILDDF